MACSGSLLLDLQPDRILVAIDSQFEHALDMSGRLPLFPERLTRTAVVPGFAAGDGLTKGFFIHMPDHQDVARFCVGHDSSNQPIRAKLRREGETLFYFGLRFSNHGQDHHCRHWPAIRRENTDPETREVRESRPRIGKISYRWPPRSIVMKRTCSPGSSRNAPVKCVVTVSAPGFSTPRSDMHMCSASIITATPRGFRISSIAVATCDVRCSCVCRRRA